MNKSRLINEVRKNPELWGKTNSTQEDEIWKEIASNIGLSPEVCKYQWKRLLMRFNVELFFCQNRQKKEEINGTCDKDKKSEWKYFDAMKFFYELKKKSEDSAMGCLIKNELLGHEQYNETDSARSLMNELENTPSCSKNSKNIFSEINLLSDNSNSNIKEEPELDIIDIYSSNETLDDEKYNESNSTSSLINDIESTPSCSKNAKNIFSEIILLSDSSNSHIKEEPELNIEDIYSSESEETSNNSSKKQNNGKIVSKQLLKTYSRKKPRETEASRNCNNENFKRFKLSILKKDFGDPDYNFLISFSPHLKLMTQLQNLQLRSEMPDLMLNMLKTSTFSNALENQMPCTHFTSLNDIIDAETNFLISFLPHLKTLSMLKNLEFRRKLTDLIWNILLSTSSVSANKLCDSKALETN